VSFWGLALLGTYLGLGLSRTPARKAATIGICLTALIILGVMAKTLP
jgi:hypothetical protein